jgi:hypothetical protein
MQEILKQFLMKQNRYVSNGTSNADLSLVASVSENGQKWE